MDRFVYQKRDEAYNSGFTEILSAQKGLIVHAWVLMPSHLHMIVSSEGLQLGDIFRDFKKHTSRRIVKELGLINESRKDWLMREFRKSGDSLKRITNHKVWKDGNHPIHLDSNKLMQEKLDYIHFNPVESEIVDEPEYYWHSSARGYAGKKGLLDLVLLE